MKKYLMAQKPAYPGTFSDSRLIFTGCDLIDGARKAPMFMTGLDGSLQEICPPGDYDHIRSVTINNATYCVFTEYQRQERRKQVMLAIIQNGAKKIMAISTPGKYDRPVIAVHQNFIVMAFEDANGPNPRIAFAVIDPNSDDYSRAVVTAHVTAPGERAYKPFLISDGDTLYLLYESFFEKRYHLMARCLSNKDCGNLSGVFAPRLELFGERAFSQGVEIGCDVCNDNAVSAALVRGKVIVCWENSSPLYPNDYKWDDGRGNIITMPSFGHGWRVETRLFARRICLLDGFLELENITNIPSADESSGAVVPLADNRGRLFFAYVCFGGYNVGWNLKLQYYSTEGSRVIDTNLYYSTRVIPTVTVSGDEIIAAGIDADRQNIIAAVISADENDKPDYAEPVFAEFKKICLSKLIDTPAFREDIRQSVETDGEKLNIYWGDLHCHSNISPCSLHKMFHCTEVDEKHRFSRDVGNMDFMMLTDHEFMNDFEWHETKKYAHLSNLDGSFVSFAGFEWNCTMQKKFKILGHYNILYRDCGDLLRIAEDGFYHIEQVWAYLKKGEVLTIPHHPGDIEHTLDWDYYNPDFEPAVEIYQVRGSYELDDMEKCPKHPENYGRFVNPDHSVRVGLDKGYKLGFTGGGEHEGVGLTAVFATELTRGAIFEAIQKRRVYGTTSVKIMLDFRLDGYFMGSEIFMPENKINILCEVFAEGTDDIERVALMHQKGEIVLTNQDGGQDKKIFKTAVEIPAKPAEAGYYYIRLTQKDGNIAWSSPIFVTTH